MTADRPEVDAPPPDRHGRRGHDRLCADLFAEHFRGLVVLADLLGADDAENVAQEAFLRLHASASRLRAGRHSGLGAAVAARRGVRQSVMVLNRTRGTVLAQTDPTLPMPSMSLVKLFIAVDLLDRSGGPDALDPTTAERLWQMITVSDDRAASALWIQGGDGAIVQRIAARFGLTAVAPPTNPGMWGDTTVTAGDLARFLRAALSDPSAGPWLAHAMESAANTGADGFDQNFGMNTVTGAGSKQGWGCCLRGVRSLDSAGFADGRIVVVLSSAPPDVSDATMRAALTATVQAAVRG